MARLKKTIFGIPSGKINDLVFKTRNGEPYISTLPAKYTCPDTPEFLQRTKAFSFSSSFCSALNKIDQMKIIWKTGDRSSFNNLMSVNCTLARKGCTFSGMALSPRPADFRPDMPEINYANKILSMVFSPFNEPLSRSKFISLAGLIFLNDPQDNNLKQYIFLPLKSEADKIPLGEEIRLDVRFTGSELEQLQKYNNKEILFLLVTCNSDLVISLVSGQISCSFPAL